MKLFLSFARMAMAELTQYLFEFWMEVGASFLAMYGVFWLWNTLYRHRPDQFAVRLDQMLTYAMLAMVLDIFLNASNLPRWYITQRIRTGDIQMDLLRPLDFPFHLLARTIGMMFFTMIIPGLPAVALGVVFLGLQGPANLSAALMFFPSLALAFLVSFGLQFLLGMIAIYAIEVRRISWVYFAVARFFSGQMFPLWIFPPLLARIAALLPFQALVGIPLSIYIGQLSGVQAIQAVALQAAWAVGLMLLGRTIWNRAHRKLIVQGG